MNWINTLNTVGPFSGFICVILVYSFDMTLLHQRRLFVTYHSADKVNHIRMGMSKRTGQSVRTISKHLHPSVKVVPPLLVPDSGMRSRDCVPLPYSPKPRVRICVHPVDEDKYVSGYLKLFLSSFKTFTRIHDTKIFYQSGQLWEGGKLIQMKKVLEKYPELQLVDLGSNIGEYALWAAAMGRHVLAVEMLKGNTELLQTSLYLSNLSSMVVVVNNALYRDHRNMTAFIWNDNLGASNLHDSHSSTNNRNSSDTSNARDKRNQETDTPDQVKQDDKQTQENATSHIGYKSMSNGDDNPPAPKATRTVSTICLDDLIPLLTRKTVYIKMDLEKSEHHVLACAHKFFSSVDVYFVQMEWLNRQEGEDRNFIMNFMTKYGFVASTRTVAYPWFLVDLRKKIVENESDIFFVNKKFVSSRT